MNEEHLKKYQDQPLQLILNKLYKFKYQPIQEDNPVLVYIGKEGNWHQFAKLTDPATVWSELLDSDLHLIEEYQNNIGELTKEEPDFVFCESLGINIEV